ncbi:transketolase [Anaerolinea thermophila]|uniref:Transketolase n=1 Tax=Anaerolinea thermophila (strain DSM 14523 / JCM 11388 / NBRC 100420 / UNI-1) TaxID=926569 RepID=E8N5X0_ANATU|nr:transketolase [Anaerolinea thermophila]BAJ63834.1 transketolase [Anaerolinea thermophila UNI-1]
METKEFQNKALNTIRFLSADGVQKANSGHPGLPMGAAAIAYTVWTRHLRHNPANPGWFNRDRFILSGGHGSMLLYSLLHLTGYDLPLEELQQFRQWGSRTPGHPEYGLTPGVETTTGPLGQGFANGVGMAIAEKHLAAVYNRPGHEIIDYFIYALVTDGDLMEGVAAEAASLAGHLKLGNLIYLYDDNRITIEGSTDVAFTEDRAKRFEAYGWQVLFVEDGNDVDAIDSAISLAKTDPRPSLIVVRTHIGYGLPTRQDTAKAHGEPPGEEELRGAKVKLGWPLEPSFYIPDDVLAFFRQAVERGKHWEEEWQRKFEAYRQSYPDLASELERRILGKLPDNWAEGLPEFPADPKGMATRVASGKVLNALAARLPELMGGSADLAPSTMTWMNSSPSFQAESPEGRNLQFGVREHGMGAIVNGMAYNGAFIPFGSTFLVFADYMRGAIRLSALSHLGSIWVFTHDSIGLGEDGPTHQPVEHLASLRAIPNLVVLRPADANETREAWKVAIERRHAPTVLALSRQPVPTLDRTELAPASGVAQGAYVLADLGDKLPEVILMASGSEVALIYEAGKELAREGIAVRLVSFPSWELFAQQDVSYRESVLPSHIKHRIAVEAGIGMGWERWVGCEGKIISIERFGASAPYKVIYQQLGLTVERIVEEAQSLLRGGY